MACVGLAKEGTRVGKLTCDPWSYGVTHRLAPRQFLEKPKVRRPWQARYTTVGRGHHWSAERGRFSSAGYEPPGVVAQVVSKGFYGRGTAGQVTGPQNKDSR